MPWPTADSGAGTFSKKKSGRGTWAEIAECLCWPSKRNGADRRGWQGAGADRRQRATPRSRKNGFLQVSERSMVILKFLKKLALNCPEPARSVASRGKTTIMKPIFYREIDLPIGRAPTGFGTGALPSPAAGRVRGTGASGLQPQVYNPVADGGWRT